MRVTRVTALGSGLLTLALVAAGTVPAQAADPVGVTIDEPRTVAIEYGETWDFPLAGDWQALAIYHYAARSGNTTVFRVRGTGTPAGYTASAYLYAETGKPSASIGSVYPDPTKPPLDAGRYSFAVVIDGTSVGFTGTGETNPGASLTISAAALSTEVRVVPDEADPASVVISARLTGRFVDEYVSGFYPNSAVSPAGTWTLVATDADGEVAVERTIERTAGDDTLATSFYWSGAKPGEQYAVTAAFLPTGQSAANFAVTPSTPLEFTAATESRAIAASAAADRPVTDLPPEPDFSVPLWWVLLIGVALAALIALAIVFASRLAKAPAASSAPSATAPGEPS